MMAARMMGTSGRPVDTIFQRAAYTSCVCGGAALGTGPGLLGSPVRTAGGVNGKQNRAEVNSRVACRAGGWRYFPALAAVSSRGLGRSPLKAQTRVRIPLPLCRPHRLTVRTPLFQGGNRSSILLGGMGDGEGAGSRADSSIGRA